MQMAKKKIVIYHLQIHYGVQGQDKTRLVNLEPSYNRHKIWLFAILLFHPIIVIQCASTKIKTTEAIDNDLAFLNVSKTFNLSLANMVFWK